MAASQAASQAASRAVSMASPFDQVEEEGRNGRNGQKLFDKNSVCFDGVSFLF